MNTAWSTLESVEHKREIALRNQLIRLERVEQLARKFERKAELREGWIAENEEVLASDSPGDSVSTVSAAMKRRDAVATDVAAHEMRMAGLREIASELTQLDYHNVASIQKRQSDISSRWDALKEKLDDRRLELEDLLQLFTIFKDMERIE